MEVHQVRYFVALARSLNFTRAAELSNVSQSALSKVIFKLEEELCGKLILRERALTQLTDLGKAVLPHMEQILVAIENVRTSAQDFRSSPGSALHIGLAPSVSPAVLSGVLAQLASSNPQLEVQIDDVANTASAEALLRGDMLAVITDSQDIGHGDRLDCWRLFDEPFVAHMPREDPLAALPTVPVTALEERQWLFCPDANLDLAAPQPILPTAAIRLRHRAKRIEQLHPLVQAGMGIAIVPAHTPCPPGLVSKPIAGRPFQRTVSLVVVAGRPHSSALSAFIRICRAYNWQRLFVGVPKPPVVTPLAVVEGVPDATPRRKVGQGAKSHADS